MPAKARQPKPKHVPQRTCLACRQVAGKRGLVRLVRTTAGIVIDSTGKQAGRGAYLHATQACWQNALNGNRIGQALRTTITLAEKEQLQTYMATLPLQE